MASSTHRAVPYLPLARMTVVSSGTGTITLGAAVSGYLTFDLAGVSTTSTGHALTYAISDGANSEVGRGVYYSSSLRLTRDSSSTGYLFSTNGNSPIAMSVSAQVFATLGAHDLYIMSPTFTSFTTVSSGNYVPPQHCVALEIIAVGAGAGGYEGGGPGVSGDGGSSGGDTTFGGILTAAGGILQTGGAGTGGNILNGRGGFGENGDYGAAAGLNPVGGNGGDSFLGTGGLGARTAGTTGSSGQYGGGGGGGGNTNTVGPGGYGGGAGGHCWHKMSISSLSSALSFAYSIGDGGVGGSGLTTGSAGGPGGNGLLIIKEYYH